MGVKDISIYNFDSLLLLGRCNLHATACAVNSTELKKSECRTHSHTCAPKPEGVTNTGNKIQQRMARWSAALLSLTLTVRDITLIWGRESGGSTLYGIRSRAKRSRKADTWHKSPECSYQPPTTPTPTSSSPSSCQCKQMGAECTVCMCRCGIVCIKCLCLTESIRVFPFHDCCSPGVCV